MPWPGKRAADRGSKRVVARGGEAQRRTRPERGFLSRDHLPRRTMGGLGPFEALKIAFAPEADEDDASPNLGNAIFVSAHEKGVYVEALGERAVEGTLEVVLEFRTRQSRHVLGDKSLRAYG